MSYSSEACFATTPGTESGGPHESCPTASGHASAPWCRTACWPARRTASAARARSWRSCPGQRHNGRVAETSLLASSVAADPAVRVNFITCSRRAQADRDRVASAVLTVAVMEFAGDGA
uniref:Uncharacterized protein n=1 Tax=Arundo donax TaxID=35708 RepID=A0A0A9EIP6_ARUDO